MQAHQAAIQPADATEDGAYTTQWIPSLNRKAGVARLSPLFVQCRDCSSLLIQMPCTQSCAPQIGQEVGLKSQVAEALAQKQMGPQAATQVCWGVREV